MLRPLAFVVALGAATPAHADAAYQLRVLPTVVWSDDVARQIGDEPSIALGGTLAAHLDAKVAEAFAEPYAAGREREGGAIGTELGNVLHVGVGVSKVVPRFIHGGNESTRVVVWANVTVFAANIATGDMLATRTASCPGPAVLQGNVTEVAPELTLELLGNAVDTCVGALVGQLASTFRPDRIGATVVGRYKDAYVLDRGYMDGGYAGEVLHVPNEPARGLRIVEAQAQLSLAMPTGAAPAVGAHLERLGVQIAAGDAPRVMVMPGDPDRFVLPGTSESEAAQLAADALGAAGFVMLPHTDAIGLAKELEAARIDVMREAIVGVQAVPDVLVLPRIAAWSVTEHEAGEGFTTYDIKIDVVLSFVDLRTGTVLHSTRHRLEQQHHTERGGRTFDPMSALPVLLGRAFVDAAKQASVDFHPHRAFGKVTSGPDGSKEFGWTVTDLPLGVGTVGEILARGPTFTGADGRDLGAVELVVGTVRVSGTNGDKERGRIVASSAAVGPGMRVRGMPSSVAGDGRVVTLGKLDLDGAPWLPREDLEDAVVAALYASPDFRTALTDDDRRRLDATFGHLAGSSFELGSGERHEAAAATLALDLSIHISVGDLVRKVVDARKAIVEVSRALSSVDTLAVRKLDDDSLAKLVHPRTGETFETYPFESRLMVPGRETRGMLPAQVTDEAMPDNVASFAFDVASELVRRAHLMLDAAAPH